MADRLCFGNLIKYTILSHGRVVPNKSPGRRGTVISRKRAFIMKYFNLLLSLCLVFMLCSSWVAAFSSLSPPEPTPPTGSPGDGSSTGFPGPPSAETTNPSPEVTTIYPIYG
ncbi:uncharacterized protein LOC108031391 [Drosophila biarmipes]|uniref:uncharacterized protein LOC108031391 n=1 Tax=Drosophila biarmipes TaxID=125945 RepID=UPI0007E76701|nr:uncharacterized protein LOC108031391 [Drosophila biarmipes]